jgi:hypothetical protein
MPCIKDMTKSMQDVVSAKHCVKMFLDNEIFEVMNEKLDRVRVSARTER